MGVVYQAYDRERKGLVALKTLRLDDSAAIYRFKREFRSLADINHPNLVTLYELVSAGDEWFFTMELIDGEDFLSVFRDIEDPVSIPSDADTLAPGRGVRDYDDPASRPEPSPPRDYGELRRALRQLAEGVQALHDASKLHRDIKPSNVMITESGRVILLDFGLVLELETSDISGSNRLLVGTAVYMSPEQAASQVLDEASDWYSVGVMLYEALTGLVPFDGPALTVVMRKQKELPARPRELVPGTPEDLDELCMSLLATEPENRPSGLQLLQSLGSRASMRLRARPITIGSRSDIFIGREKQLTQLDRAYDEFLGGELVSVFIHGRSGTGKTALLEHYLDLLTGRKAIVLAGRCYEREYVPYKALDALVDSLTQYLAKVPDDEVGQLIPLDAAAITRLFPVFRRAGSPTDLLQRRDTGDPLEQRRRGTAALREILFRIASRQPLVLSIDNLQWSDMDSVGLLIDLIRPPNPPPLFLLVAYRSEEATVSKAVRLFLRSLRTAEIARHEVVVGALGTDETWRLLHHRLGKNSAEIELFGESLVSESGGNPFFIAELVRYIQSGAAVSGDRSSVSLQEAMEVRLSQLPEAPLRVIEVVSIAGRPLDQATVATAARLGPGLAPVLAQLRAGSLVRTRGTSDHDPIEIYHERIRETVLASLSAERLARLHAELAAAMEAGGRASAEQLVFHFQEAGNHERAGHHAIQAASNASDALAFEQAADLYRLAIEYLPERTTVERGVRAALGDALANAGMVVQAAEAYETAAARASAADALEFQRRAVEQRLRAGNVDRGLDALDAVLGAVGIRMSRSSPRVLASVMTRRARLRLRGLRFKERDTSQIAPQDLTRIDVCWTAAASLGMIDPAQGADFQARHLSLALRAGEPYRVTRALALEAMYSASAGVGTSKRTQHFIDLAGDLIRRLTEQQGERHAAALVVLARAFKGYHTGDYGQALSLCKKALETLRDECTGVALEIGVAQRVMADALYQLGEMAKLREHVRDNLREAERRGDRYGATAMRTGLPNVVWLVDDEPDRAREEATSAMESWSRSGFHLQHYYHVTARARAALYAGDGTDGHREMVEMWPRLRRSRFMRAQALRVEAMFMRGRTAVAAALDAGEGKAQSSGPMLDDAMAMARKMAKERTPTALSESLVLQAGIARARGANALCVEHLERASGCFDELGMEALAAACQLLVGELGGAAGAEQVQAARRWMESRAIREPTRFTALLTGIHGEESG